MVCSGVIPMSAPKTIRAVQNAGGDERDEWWLRGEVHDKTNDYPYSALNVCDGYCPVRSPLTVATYGVRPLIHIDSVDGLNE